MELPGTLGGDDRLPADDDAAPVVPPQRDPSTEDSWVRFYFDDADPVAECACGWHTHGDSASDAFGAWWKHRREHDDAAGEQRPVVLSARVDLDLDQIEARANAATPGPWDVGPYGTSFTSRHVGRIILAPMIAPASFDAEFIAHAREDVPALVAEVQRLRVENERLNRILFHGAGTELAAERDAARAEAERQRERADHNAAAVNENADEIVRLRAEAARLREALQAVRERAKAEIADAKEGEHYHAEVNNAAGLAAEQSRRSAWESVVRALDAALDGAE